MKRLLLLLAAGCGGSTEPTVHDLTPFDHKETVGVYDVQLNIASQGSFGPSCGTVRITLGLGANWSAQCINGVTPAGTIGVDTDTLALHVSSGGATRPILLYDFSGSETSPRSDWSGAYCWPNAAVGGCVREHGTAVWTRR